MAIDYAKLFRLSRDLQNLHGARYGMSKMQRDAALQIRDIQSNPRPADPATDARRIKALQDEAADLAARLTELDRDVQALHQLVTACQRYVDEEAAAEVAAKLAANLATTTTEDQQ